jgi:hypothetical protein
MFDNSVIKENKAELTKAATKIAAATPKTPTGFVKIAWDYVFPMLPMLLLAFAPKLISSKKSISILRKADEIIDQVLAMVPAEE